MQIFFFPIKVHHLICNPDEPESEFSGSPGSSEFYTDNRDFNANDYDEVLQIFSKNQVNFSEFRQYLLNSIMSLKQKTNGEVLEFSYEDKLLEIYGKILNFKTILTLIKLVFFSNNKTLK
jgi:hypothetical protein